MGHLVRSDDGRRLYLYPPHIEMLSLRYLLVGKTTKQLEKLVENVAEFPTDGGHFSDGDLSKTPHDIIELWRTSGSEQRFSPVLAAVEGRAVYLSLLRYEMEVHRIRWTIDYPSWAAFKKKRLTTLLGQTTRAIRRGDLDSVVQQLEVYLKRLDHRFKGLGPCLPLYQKILRFKVAVAEASVRLGKDPTPKTLRRTCGDFAEDFYALPQTLVDALKRCNTSGTTGRNRPRRKRGR